MFKSFKSKKEYIINKLHWIRKYKFVLIMLTSFLIGFLIGNQSTMFNNKKTKYNIDKNLIKFIENYNYIINNYYEEIDKDELIDNAISGMINSLEDSYSLFMDENSSSNFNVNLNGEYKGLGISVAENEETGFVEIIDVLEDSSAFEVGLQKGDLIVKINSKETNNMSINEFSSYVLSSSSDTFDIVVQRNDKKETYTITKKNITINSVDSKTIEVSGKSVGYIYTSIFADNTDNQFFHQLKKLEEKNIEYLIIDVRNNGGGNLNTVERILKKFLTKKQIVYQLKTGKKIEKIYGSASKNKDYKIILLSNEYSASASEMLIAALKENLSCVVFGEKTYGKGTVQELISLKNGKQYKITTKKWLTPNGNWVNDTNGITPDYNVALTSEEDEQLNAVIEYIKNDKNK